MELASKALALACAAMLAVVAVLGWRLHAVKQDVQVVTSQLVDAKAQLAAAQAAKAALDAGKANAAKAQAIIDKHEEKASAHLQSALQAAPDWSDTPVPDAVIDSLHQNPVPASSAGQAH